MKKNIVYLLFISSLQMFAQTNISIPQNYYIAGPQNGEITINIKGNWTNNGELNPANTNVIANGNSQQTIFNPTGYFSKLTLHNTTTAESGILLTSNINISNKLTLSGGVIETGTNMIELGTSALNIGTLERTSGFILGSMKRWFAESTNNANQGLFPLGADGFYRPMIVEFTDAPSEGGSLTATFVETAMGWQHSAISPIIPQTGSCLEFKVSTYSDEGYWEVNYDGTGMNTATYTITIEGGGFQTISNDDFCQLTALRRQGEGKWEVPVGSTHFSPLGSVSAPIVYRSGNKGWSNWGIGGGGDNALPIELLSFYTECKDEGVLIKWITASETNNDYFIIEKYQEYNTWKKIAKIEGAGSSNSNIEYNFLDKNAFQNGTYYRIKQVDYDGKSETFSPVFANCNYRINNNINVYPNPFSDEITIDFNNQNSSFARIYVFNSMGQIVFSSSLHLSDENTKSKINLKKLVPAVYNIIIHTNDSSLNHRIIKQH
jgi:hypothetical protein